MKFKTITYRRVLNLGNYESKQLEMTIEVDAHLELAEEECSTLMEAVERKIREHSEAAIKEDIRAAREELRKIQAKYELFKKSMDVPPATSVEDYLNTDNEENEGF